MSHLLTLTVRLQVTGEAVPPPGTEFDEAAERKKRGPVTYIPFDFHSVCGKLAFRNLPKLVKVTLHPTPYTNRGRFLSFSPRVPSRPIVSPKDLRKPLLSAMHVINTRVSPLGHVEVVIPSCGS